MRYNVILYQCSRQGKVYPVFNWAFFNPQIMTVRRCTSERVSSLHKKCCSNDFYSELNFHQRVAKIHENFQYLNVAKLLTTI